MKSLFAFFLFLLLCCPNQAAADHLVQSLKERDTLGIHNYFIPDWIIKNRFEQFLQMPEVKAELKTEEEKADAQNAIKNLIQNAEKEKKRWDSAFRFLLDSFPETRSVLHLSTDTVSAAWLREELMESPKIPKKNIAIFLQNELLRFHFLVRTFEYNHRRFSIYTLEYKYGERFFAISKPGILHIPSEEQILSLYRSGLHYTAQGDSIPQGLLVVLNDGKRNRELFLDAKITYRLEQKSFEGSPDAFDTAVSSKAQSEIVRDRLIQVDSALFDRLVEKTGYDQQMETVFMFMISQSDLKKPESLYSFSDNDQMINYTLGIYAFYKGYLMLNLPSGNRTEFIKP